MKEGRWGGERGGKGGRSGRGKRGGREDKEGKRLGRGRKEKRHDREKGMTQPFWIPAFPMRRFDSKATLLG